MTPSELRHARKVLGLTQTELANALRMGKYGWQTIHRWENGSDDEELRGEISVAIEALLLASVTRDSEAFRVDSDYMAVPREVYEGLINLAPEEGDKF